METYIFGDRRQWRAKTREMLPDHADAFNNLGRGGFSTHGVLDACTSYGTQLGWPFSDVRFAWSNVSIVDPLFTAPIVLLAATAARRAIPLSARMTEEIGPTVLLRRAPVTTAPADPAREADHIYLLRHTLMNPWLLDGPGGRSYIDLYWEYLEAVIDDTLPRHT